MGGLITHKRCPGIAYATGVFNLCSAGRLIAQFQDVPLGRAFSVCLDAGINTLITGLEVRPLHFVSGIMPL